MAPRHARSWDECLAKYKHNNENGLPMLELRAWTYRQRKANADGTLSAKRKEKLNGVGFVWNANSQSQFDHDAWDRKLELLKTHHLEKGNCDGPYDDKQLLSWVQKQRSELKNKESLNEIQNDRWARLNALGFWAATERQRELQEAMSNAREMGQCRQGSGAVSSTVSHRYFCGSNHPLHDQSLPFHVACISKSTRGGDSVSHVSTLIGPAYVQDRTTLAVVSTSINSAVNGSVVRPTQGGHSWDEMFDACKYITETGLPFDDSQISWMSEQWRRKDKLDSVGVAWYIACNFKPAADGENQNEVGTWMGFFCCVAVFVFAGNSMASMFVFEVCSLFFLHVLDRCSG
jgi:Helicase associated domain